VRGFSKYARRLRDLFYIYPNNYKTYKPYIKQHRRLGARIVPLVHAGYKRTLFHEPVLFIVEQDRPSASEDKKITVQQEMQKQKKIVLVAIMVRRLPQEPHVRVGNF
jgi:hypothetical protein